MDYKISELKNDPEIYKYHQGAKENVENFIMLVKDWLDN